MKHTPGPWRVFRNPNGRVLISGGNKDEGQCFPVLHTMDSSLGEEHQANPTPANANLIAAAPDMAELLADIYEQDQLGSCILNMQCRKKIKELLIKSGNPFDYNRVTKQAQLINTKE